MDMAWCSSHVHPDAAKLLRKWWRPWSSAQKHPRSPGKMSWKVVKSSELWIFLEIPSGYVKIAIENSHRNTELSHEKLWFSSSLCKRLPEGKPKFIKFAGFWSYNKLSLRMFVIKQDVRNCQDCKSCWTRCTNSVMLHMFNYGLW